MIFLGDLDDAGRARFEAAVARVRALEVRMGMGAGAVILMAAGDSVEMKRAAWRARRARCDFRMKNSIGRIVLKELPHDPFIQMMLRSGFYVRPLGREPTFKGAAKAFERMVGRMMATDSSRVIMEKLLIDSAHENIGTNQEAENHGSNSDY